MSCPARVAALAGGGAAGLQLQELGRDAVGRVAHDLLHALDQVVQPLAARCRYRHVADGAAGVVLPGDRPAETGPHLIVQDGLVVLHADRDPVDRMAGQPAAARDVDCAGARGDGVAESIAQLAVEG